MKRILLFVLLLTNYCVFGQDDNCRSIGIYIGYLIKAENLRTNSASLSALSSSRLSPTATQSDDEFPFTFCPGSNVYLRAETLYSPIQITKAIYEWSGPNDEKGNNSLFDLKKINQSTAGGYTLKTTISRQGCPDTTLIQIRQVVVAVPKVQVSDRTVCEGGDVKLEPINNNEYILDRFYDISNKAFTWSGPNGFTSSESSPTIKNLKESGIYTATVTFSGLCVATSQTTVKLTQVKESFVKGDLFAYRGCLGGQITLSAVPTVAGATGTYIWKGPNDFSQEGQQITIKNLTEKEAGLYKIIARFKGGCSNSDSANVTLDIPSPMPKFDIIPEFCEGGTMIFPKKSSYYGIYFNGNSKVSYSWTGPNGFKSNQELPAIYNFKKEQIGNYELEITFTGACNTTAKRIFPVKPIERPFVSINTYTTNNLTDKTENKVIYAEPYSHLNSYSWTGPDNFSSNNYFVTIEKFDTKKAGLYTLGVKAPGCKENSVASINLKQDTITTTQKTIRVSAGTYGSYCKGSAVTLLAVTEPYDSKTTYKWFGSNGFKAEGREVKIENINENSGGIYTVFASNSYGENYDTTSIKILKLPQISLVDTLKICEGGIGYLSPWSFSFNQGQNYPGIDIDVYDPTTFTYEWTGPNNFKSTNLPIEFRHFNKTQQGDYEFKTTFTGGCEGTYSKKVKVIASEPEVNWSIDRLCNDKVLVTPTLKYFSYDVMSKMKIFDSDNKEVSNPIEVNSSSNNYTVELSIEGGCTLKTQKQINTKEAKPFQINLPTIIETCVNKGISFQAPIPLSNFGSGSSYYYYDEPLMKMYNRWTGPNGLISNNNYFSIQSIKKANAGTYKLTTNLIGECTGTYEAETILKVDTEKPEISFFYTQNKQTLVIANVKSNDEVNYLWDFGNGQKSSMQNPDTVRYANAGQYIISLDASNGCGTFSRKISITIENEEDPEIVLGNETLIELLTFTVSPNPSAGMVEISNPNKLDVQISVHSMDGKTLGTFSVDSSQATVTYDFSTYAAGVYLIKCVQKNGQVRTRKIVIHK